jgi:hypothetical protein
VPLVLSWAKQVVARLDLSPLSNPGGLPSHKWAWVRKRRTAISVDSVLIS